MFAAAMFCLAGLGGKVEPIMKKTASASKILAIDGCNLDCVKLCLKEAGFSDFEHMRVTDLGMEKGKSQPSEDNINKVVKKGKEMIG